MSILQPHNEFDETFSAPAFARRIAACLHAHTGGTAHIRVFAFISGRHRTPGAAGDSRLRLQLGCRIAISGFFQRRGVGQIFCVAGTILLNNLLFFGSRTSSRRSCEFDTGQPGPVNQPMQNKRRSGLWVAGNFSDTTRSICPYR